MYKVTVTLKHDGGRVRISTVASTAATGIKMILDAEGAPARSIVRVHSKPL
jgi:hypothetical protein